MCSSPSAAVRSAATATFKRTVLALLATRATETGPCAESDGAHSGGPSAVASGALPALLPLPGMLLVFFCLSDGPHSDAGTFIFLVHETTEGLLA